MIPERAKNTLRGSAGPVRTTLDDTAGTLGADADQVEVIDRRGVAAPMGAATIKHGPQGEVARDEMWTGFCRQEHLAVR
jgi:hypothetical protein